MVWLKPVLQLELPLESHPASWGMRFPENLLLHRWVLGVLSAPIRVLPCQLLSGLLVKALTKVFFHILVDFFWEFVFLLLVK